jgi:hypothetical protein
MYAQLSIVMFLTVLVSFPIPACTVTAASKWFTLTSISNLPYYLLIV